MSEVNLLRTSDFGLLTLNKQLACKPDSVMILHLRETSGHLPSFILAIHHCMAHTTYPPAVRAVLWPVYMVFQPIRCTAYDVAITTGELLPHLFTLAFVCAQADVRHYPGFPRRSRPERSRGAVFFCYTTIPSRISSR
jgi:hypothetical protein